MKTPEEIKNGLKEIARYWRGWNEEDAANDALAYIEQQEERIGLLKLQLRGDCDTCKHRNVEYTCRVCCDDEYAYHPLWEYEGFPGERKDDHEKPV